MLSLVGRGAVGEVYAAYDPELDRKVAIKLLRVRDSGQNPADGRLRLMREAQAIAKVSHPNVVIVFDVGTFEEQVFVAMEFVEGQTLRYWMEAKEHAWPDVLKVFVDAGRGLVAAHEKDLVHRDFKPDNVMIGSDGHVRVMDFGLARIVGGKAQVVAAPERPPAAEPRKAPTSDEDDLEATRDLSDAVVVSRRDAVPSIDPQVLELTVTGSVVGTPAYMSPEQFSGRPAGAQADQFSFCVTLYEALYGERPFVGRTFIELADNIGREAIRPPPKNRDVPEWIRKIVLRGLRCDETQRWPSMRALLSELENDQRTAGHDRFVAGAAGKLAGIWEAPINGHSVESAGKTEIRKAFAVTGKHYAGAAFDTVSRMLDAYTKSWTEMYIDACEATHLRGEQSAEVLDLRMAFLRERLAEVRALCQMFRRADAEVVENAVKAAGSLGSLDRCADVRLLRSIVKPPDDPAAQAAVEETRGRLAEARLLGHAGRLLSGLAALEPLERQARALGYGPLIAEVLLERGRLNAERREASDAVAVLEEAIWTAELSRHDEVAAEAATYLVYAAGNTQLRFDAGEIWARHAEMLLARLGGHEHLRGWLFNNRGAMRERQGRLADALRDAELAVAAKERALGPDSSDVALSLGNMALYLDQMGQREQAIEHMRRAVRILEAELGPDHPAAAVQISNYGEILNRMERFAEAEAASARALAALECENVADSLVLSYPLTALGIARLGRGNATDALSVLERAAAIREAKEGQPALRGETHFALARALWGSGRDRPRALQIAARARAEYEESTDLPGVVAEIACINTWLTERSLAVPAAGAVASVATTLP